MVLNFNPMLALARTITRGALAKPAAMMVIPLDFTAGQTYSASLPVTAGIKNVTGLNNIQSVFIDNSNNGQLLTLTFDFPQTIVVPAYCQGIFPLFFPGNNLNFTAFSTGNVIVKLQFLNTREYAQIWTSRIPISGAVSVTGSQVYTQPASGSFIDASLVIPAANTSEPLLVANGARQLLAIRNPATAASQGIAAPEPVYLGFGAAAAVNGASSWELLPGESLPQFLMTSTDAINVACATINHQLICKYM